MDKQFVKKISRGTVFGDKTDVLELVMKNREADNPLYSVGGTVTRIETVKSKFKPDGDDDYSDEGSPKERRTEYKLLGDFEAVNHQTGEVFKSPICWLPAFAAAMIVGKFQEGDSLEFAMLIGAKFNADVATSYEFTVRPLMTEAPTAEQTRIQNLLMKSLPKGKQPAQLEDKSDAGKNNDATKTA